MLIESCFSLCPSLTKYGAFIAINNFQNRALKSSQNWHSDSHFVKWESLQQIPWDYSALYKCHFWNFSLKKVPRNDGGSQTVLMIGRTKMSSQVMWPARSKFLVSRALPKPALSPWIRAYMVVTVTGAGMLMYCCPYSYMFIATNAPRGTRGLVPVELRWRCEKLDKYDLIEFT